MGKPAASEASHFIIPWAISGEVMNPRNGGVQERLDVACIPHSPEPAASIRILDTGASLLWASKVPSGSLTSTLSPGEGERGKGELSTAIDRVSRTEAL